MSLGIQFFVKRIFLNVVFFFFLKFGVSFTISISNEESDIQKLKFSICDFSVTDIVLVTEKSQFSDDIYGTCESVIEKSQFTYTIHVIQKSQIPNLSVLIF